MNVFEVRTDSERYLRMLSLYKCFDLAFSFCYSDSMNRTGGSDREAVKKNCEAHSIGGADPDRSGNFADGFVRQIPVGELKR